MIELKTEAPEKCYDIFYLNFVDKKEVKAEVNVPFSHGPHLSAAALDNERQSVTTTSSVCVLVLTHVAETQLCGSSVKGSPQKP